MTSGVNFTIRGAFKSTTTAEGTISFEFTTTPSTCRLRRSAAPRPGAPSRTEPLARIEPGRQGREALDL